MSPSSETISYSGLACEKNSGLRADTMTWQGTGRREKRGMGGGDTV